MSGVGALAFARSICSCSVVGKAESYKHCGGEVEAELPESKQ